MERELLVWSGLVPWTRSRLPSYLACQEADIGSELGDLHESSSSPWGERLRGLGHGEGEGLVIRVDNESPALQVGTEVSDSLEYGFQLLVKGDPLLLSWEKRFGEQS